MYPDRPLLWLQQSAWCALAASIISQVAWLSQGNWAAAGMAGGMSAACLVTLSLVMRLRAAYAVLRAQTEFVRVISQARDEQS